MRITVETRAPGQRKTDLLAVLLTELDPAHWRLPARIAALDRSLDGTLAQVLGTGDFRGKRGDSLLVYARDGDGPRRILLVGLGEASEVDAEALREAAAQATASLRQRKGKQLAVAVPALRRVRAPAAAAALAEGLVLAGYRFQRYRSGNGGEEESSLESAFLSIERSQDLRAARAAVGAAVNVAESQNLARDLSNEPPNELPPVALAKAAQKMGKDVGLKVRVLGPAELEKREFGALLAVAGGSTNPPRLIVMEHNAPSGKTGKSARKRRTVCLVGKGVTFDSGGLSLKPSASMVKMKHDMSGAAAVIGAMRAVALLRVPLHVVGIVGAVENMPSGTAYRPDDILTSRSGKTIEITNTDAEGRLVLADALDFARTEYEPEAMVDLATLTGAAAVALGSWSAAVLANDDRLRDAIVKAGEATSERYWPLPLWDVHREHMRSHIADVKQTGGREAGTITATAFLANFVGDTPWAHLDIASVADTERQTALQPRGATGFGVRSVVELVRGLARSRLG